MRRGALGITRAENDIIDVSFVWMTARRLKGIDNRHFTFGERGQPVDMAGKENKNKVSKTLLLSLYWDDLFLFCYRQDLGQWY